MSLKLTEKIWKKAKKQNIKVIFVLFFDFEKD